MEATKQREARHELARSHIYGLLSALFLYPDEEILSRPDWQESEEALALLDASPGLREALSSVRACRRDSAELESEYVRIFGHALSEECPPYESQHGSAHVFQQTQTLADIAAFYRAFGVEVSDLAKERLDHISIELEFMAFLSYKLAYALASGGSDNAETCQDARRKFLSDHLGRWAPVFTRRLEMRANEGFYQGLARLTEKFLAFEIESLGAAPEVEGLAPVPFGPEGRCFMCDAGDACVPEGGS